MMRRATVLLSAFATLTEATELVITTGLQTGIFGGPTRTDIGPLNPHDYRPNEFVTADFIFEGLVEWDGAHPNGQDGVAGTMDDYVKPALATSWTTNTLSNGRYEVEFTLRSGVTFHDGSAWNAAAAKANFDQIMGGDGSSLLDAAAGLGPNDPNSGVKKLVGLHDWMGFTQSLDAWAATGAMTFKLTFTTYYESALRELAVIRPFRFSSVAAFPSGPTTGANAEVSHNKFRGGSHTFGWRGGVTFRGVSAPIGTGPYKVISKQLANAAGPTRVLPAADFNASCYNGDSCSYNAGEWVSEVLFEKNTGHYKLQANSYDTVKLRAYNSIGDIKAALLNGTLHVAYGVNVFSPGGFLSLATSDGANVVAHEATSNLNTRLLVLNSGGRLNTPDLRKLVMGILEGARDPLYNGELSGETPTDHHFDPALPYCSALSSYSTPAQLAATKSPSVTAASITRPLRFMYIKDIPHQQIIAAEVIATLYAAGIAVTPMPVTKDTYNTRHCDWITNPNGVSNINPTYYAYGGSGNATEENHHAWDIAYSETWGPPYDATMKLWDMTHGLNGWCSNEADAPAVSNMASMPYATFESKVKALSTTTDATLRQTRYNEIFSTLHSEAIFLPLTYKKQVAVTSTSVSGFRFGYQEYDLPLVNLHPTPAPAPPGSVASIINTLFELPAGAIVGIIAAVVLAVLFFFCLVCLICREKAGKPIFTDLGTATKGGSA